MLCFFDVLVGVVFIVVTPVFIAEKGGNCPSRAGVTQLVEFLPSKQVVAGSSPVSRSTKLSDKLPWLKCQSWGKSESDKLHRADRNER